MFALWLVFLLMLYTVENDAARILAYYPTPSISHQVVFRPLTLELLRKGHEVVVFTTDPIFTKEETPANLTEINLHDLSYDLWINQLMAATASSQGNKKQFKKHIRFFNELIINLIEQQLSTDGVQAIINDKTKKFDLLIVEAYLDAALGLSNIVKAPVIQFSSFGSFPNNLATVGAPKHPILYPMMMDDKIHNLTFWEKLSRIQFFYDLESSLKEIEKLADEMLQKLLGRDVTSISELKNNVDMLFLNVHSIWELNRPVPPNVIYLGGMHQKPHKELPKDLKEYLDSSQYGFIYVSFGTNADPALLPPHKIQTLVNVFSKLPYDILWKWNTDELPGRSKNIKISKWLPQSDLLKHPKIKLFVTQGGLQSTDEAITAGVPLLGIPMIGDQWYNVEQYEYYKVGVHVDMETITEEKLSNAVNEILNNNERFPANCEIKTKWVMATGRTDWKPTKYTKICSVHFDTNCFVHKKKVVLLKPNSVPVKHVHPSTINGQEHAQALEARRFRGGAYYRQNMVRLRSLLQDQPERPLDRAVWWTEYVLRHGGAKHLRSPAANLSWTQYLELELVFYLLAASTLVLVTVVTVTLKVYWYVKKQGIINFKTKLN